MTFKFGEKVTNISATPGTPLRHGYFVKIKHINSFINRGKWIQITDGKGEFHDIKNGYVKKGWVDDRE